MRSVTQAVESRTMEPIKLQKVLCWSLCAMPTRVVCHQRQSFKMLGDSSHDKRLSLAASQSGGVSRPKELFFFFCSLATIYRLMPSVVFTVPLSILWEKRLLVEE